MLDRIFTKVLWAVGLGALAGLPCLAGPICDTDGVQASGSIYRICMPPEDEYNGHLVLWAHGFQDAVEPVGIPEDQLSFEGTSFIEIFTALGFGFATNSYSKTGLAVRQGMADLLDLVDIYTAEHGAPEKVFLTGASEGGLITTLLVEQRPDIFAGGVAACGPIGRFASVIQYMGDSRVTFEYFFPGMIPGEPLAPTTALAEMWEAFYQEVVRPTVFDEVNAPLLDQWARVARLPFDPANRIETLEESVSDVLRYAVVNLNDASETLGGFPFGNRLRWYSGSENDFRLNRRVLRFAVDRAAVEELSSFYDTTGELAIPLITLHTRLDQQVPFQQQRLYEWKTLRSGSYLRRYVGLPVNRYGHCEFTLPEAMASVGLLMLYTGDLELLSGVGSILDDGDLAAFEELARRVGLPYDPAWRLVREID